ncbi:UNKNOWN [Stylonychia lemnae]|uniref:Transmembrane protein n=1 Tax=Stylonychia lemnae TaxID=5949 RepID=A0A078ARU9_STYLE|nr:UNKNOWN [Stylonychia lemnae]|eukprot:CDW84899.1 UNKNOWN [Stylonychia lemnae]
MTSSEPDCIRRCGCEPLGTLAQIQKCQANCDSYGFEPICKESCNNIYRHASNASATSNFTQYLPPQALKFLIQSNVIEIENKEPLFEANQSFEYLYIMNVVVFIIAGISITAYLSKKVYDKYLESQEIDCDFMFYQKLEAKTGLQTQPKSQYSLL